MKREIKLNEGLEEFLIKGNMSNSPYWNNQLLFFFITFFFIVIQFFVSKIIPVICIALTICALFVCKKNENRLYANVYNGFIQAVIWIVVWWIDGWCSLSIVLEEVELIIAFLIGTILYLYCVFWKVKAVERKIKKNWYKNLGSTTTNVVGVVGIVAIVGMGIRFAMKNIQLENEIAFVLLATIFFALSFLFIFATDLGVRIFYYSKLSEDDKKRIANIKMKKNMISEIKY